MIIMIAGASGFIGKKLCEHLYQQGHQILTVGRKRSLNSYPYQALNWRDIEQSVQLGHQLSFPSPQIIINLAGETIQGYWTKKKKQKILQSRLSTNHLLLQFSQKYNIQNYMTASAIGYYGDRGDKFLTEASDAGTDFLADTCNAIEKMVSTSDYAGNKTILRTAIVLDASGGILKALSPFLRLKLCPIFGEGNNFLSTISLRDYCRAISFIIDHNCENTIINLADNSSLSWNEWAKKRGLKAIHFPAFFAKLLLGESSILVLGGQRIIPTILNQANFTYLDSI